MPAPTSARARTARRAPRRVYVHRFVPVMAPLDVDMVRKATLNGAKVDARLINAVTDIELELTFEAASQLTLTVEDDGYDILRSDLLAGAIDFALPGGGRWRMNRARGVGGLSIQGSATQIRLWDLGAAALQERTGYLRRPAATTNLDGFVRLLAREVAGDVRLTVVVPAPGEVPFLEEISTKSGSSSPTGSGFSPGAAGDVRVKGVRATREQVRVMDAVLTAAMRHRPSPLAMLTLAAMITVESEYRNAQGTGADAISWGVIQAIPGLSRGVDGPFTRSQAMDIAYSVKSALLPPGPTSRGGIIKVARQHPELDPGTIAEICINGVGVGDPLYVAKVNGWSEEAKRNIALWTGQPFSASSSSVTVDSGPRYAPAEWRRGGPKKRESSWGALGRYAEQLGRRRFVAVPTSSRPRLIVAQDQQLILAQPHMTVAFDDPILTEQPSIEFDGFDRLQQIELTVLASGWSAPPGAVVDLAEAGPLNGPWLVDDLRVKAGDVTAQVTLAQPTTKREPDPAASSSARLRSKTKSLRDKIVAVAKQSALNYEKHPTAYHYLKGGVPNSEVMKPTPASWRSDCSQWAAGVYRRAGAPCPGGGRYEDAFTGSMVRQGHRTTQPRHGDLIFYGPLPIPHHVEIYIGEGSFKSRTTIGHGSPPIDEGTIDMLGGGWAWTYDFLDG